MIGELFATNCAFHTPDGALQGEDGARQLYNAYATATVQGIAIFRLAGGKADEVRFVWDRFALMQQIGALAPIA